jgi:hypothetical protein
MLQGHKLVKSYKLQEYRRTGPKLVRISRLVRKSEEKLETRMYIRRAQLKYSFTFDKEISAATFFKMSKSFWFKKYRIRDLKPLRLSKKHGSKSYESITFQRYWLILGFVTEKIVLFLLSTFPSNFKDGVKPSWQTDSEFYFFAKKTVCF